MKETEATQTIVQRLAISANMLREVAAMHDLGNPILVEPASYVQRSRLEFEARDEITRLQSELNTALERVKELEEAHRKIASTPYCGFAITSGLSRSDLEELVGTFWKEFETRVSISSAVLQSSGGK